MIRKPFSKLTFLLVIGTILAVVVGQLFITLKKFLRQGRLLDGNF